eukprot:TRINITY_DN31704_c0_g1_i1.p1 TRINITY_DN31704_c0_g1~~TRINITY_DN31704_c0_g1_i1.p1  ORF type:complete len:531 (-),score=82.31 TRINITY_DN31704_c0_g1_i1:20-1555(-)
MSPCVVSLTNPEPTMEFELSSRGWTAQPMATAPGKSFFKSRQVSAKRSSGAVLTTAMVVRLSALLAGAFCSIANLAGASWHLSASPAWSFVDGRHLALQMPATEVLQPLASSAAASKCIGRTGLHAASRAGSPVQRQGMPPGFDLNPGSNTDSDGFEELCTRWNREEAENVEKSKRTLQSPKTPREAKFRAIDELEYWAIRRGGYDAEIVLIGTLRHPDRDLAGQAHIALKKTWANHFNVWVNNRISNAQVLEKTGQTEEAMKVYDALIFENPLWGEGYHLRAKLWNKLGDMNKTVLDLEKALEFCPNNYLLMVELGLIVMGDNLEFQNYERAGKLLHSAIDLCPLLPTSAFMASLYIKAPHLRPAADEDDGSIDDMNSPPKRLLPDHWVEREEATERPNQLFLRVGAELEQWFALLRQKELSPSHTRKLWSVLVIAWDPDKYPRPLRSFMTQVHDALKNRRERVLAKAIEDAKDLLPEQAKNEDNDDARAFLRRVRMERRRQRESESVER